MTKKILIFRRGSIGDAVVSIPALNIIETEYKDCELRILTNTPIQGAAAPIQAMLGETNFIRSYFSAPPGGGGLAFIQSLRNKISGWGPKNIIQYCMEQIWVFDQMFGILIF